MSTFPKEVWLSVSGKSYVQGECKIIARVQPGDDVAAIQSHYGRRLMWYEIGADGIEDLPFLTSLKGQRVRIHADTAVLTGLEEQMRALRQTRPVFVLKPGVDILRQVNVIASIRFRVHIDASQEVTDIGVMRKLTDYFLYNPVLMSPIEPLTTLLAHLTRGKGHTLWETEHKRPNAAFLDEKWRVTASRRWAEREEFYGSFEDGWETLSSSPLADRLRSTRRTLIHASKSCTTCRHLVLCRGYLKARDADAICMPWQESFDQLQTAVRTSHKIINTFTGSGNGLDKR